MEFSNCKWCGKQLDARNGDECYQCFITRLEVERNPEIAAKVLAHLTTGAVDGAIVMPSDDAFRVVFRIDVGSRTIPHRH